MRKGMGKGTGKGYKNIIGIDSRVHSMSAKGVKQPQKISPLVNTKIAKGVVLSEQKIETDGKTEIKLMLRKQAPLMTAREIFIKRFGKDKPNFMTPNIERYGKLSRDIAYELSSGDSLFDRNKRIYGVTIVKVKPDGTTETLFDHSKSFDSKADAQKYITQLKTLKDSDKDGIPDKFDCDSTDPTKQDNGYGQKNINPPYPESSEARTVEVDEFVAGLEDRADGESNMSFGSKLKALGKKVGEGVGKGVEATKKRIAEEKEKAKVRRLENKKAELKELKRPEAKKLEAQEKRVDELRFQIEAEEDEEEKYRLKEELDSEEYQLNERIEEVTNINLEDYSDNELRRLAIRHKPNDGIFTEIFGSGENPYKKELVRRIETTKKLNQDLNKARKGKVEEKGGLFDF